MPTYLIIEHFRAGKVRELYRRFDERGRMLPPGLHYLDSWINESVTTCYQLMESDSREALEEWMDHWKDLVDFEVVPVISSARAREKALGGAAKK
ncbi:DUF3303 domain-containing protein [Flavilitoribacter nigricans]|uniref:DUF3303 domain-containing protein n=1 Tax=Flavilitoribacter nigricans (strain ATCC 23147 / DSM 23189 / NBRC 102662 / NCIMB 1420 / SS-2) TaxID=1122177 RepID=A0A2D0NH98_FLAN2|nr:DUF3303 family protein [Flavilitoribacter nigricans]PHN07861.1 hypothetical protein CRP01_03675 [Flavilitoribacter nigricans DSM 23189 = NBRC 102662]